jgi:hypothetical protein
MKTAQLQNPKGPVMGNLTDAPRKRHRTARKKGRKTTAGNRGHSKKPNRMMAIAAASGALLQTAIKLLMSTRNR